MQGRGGRTMEVKRGLGKENVSRALWVDPHGKSPKTRKNDEKEETERVRREGGMNDGAMGDREE